MPLEVERNTRNLLENGELSFNQVSEKIKLNIGELCEKFRGGNLSERISELIKELNEILGENELLSNRKLLDAIRDRLLSFLKSSSIDKAENLIKFLKEHFENFDENDLFFDKKVSNEIKIILCDYLIHGCVGKAENLINFLSNHYIMFDKKNLFSDKKILKSLGYELYKLLPSVKADKIIQFLRNNLENYDEIIKQEARHKLYDYLRNGHQNWAEDLITFLSNHYENFNKDDFFSDEKFREGIQDGLCGSIMSLTKDRYSIDSFIQFIADHQENLKKEIIFSDKVFRTILLKMSNCLHSKKGNVEYLNGILETYFEDRLRINQEHLELVSKNQYFDLVSIQIALENDPNIIKIENGTTKINYENLYLYLLVNNVDWQDRQIYEPFERGGKLFGYNLMFEYIHNSNCSLHDKMIGFDAICDLCEILCDTPNERKSFFHNILKHVKDDGSSYDEGTAYHHINALARDLRERLIDKESKELNVKELNTIFNTARKLEKDLPEIRELINCFISDGGIDKSKIIVSWKNLKNFIKLKEIVDNESLHIKLAEIRRKDPALYRYVAPLLFHKGSNIDKNAVWEFIENPEKFFSRGGSDIGPHYEEYGLTAKELQQAIVNGKLDEIQEIRPMEIEYAVRQRSTVEYLIEALGIRSQGINGKASNPKNLYRQIQSVLHIESDEIVAILNGSRALVKNEDIDEENEILRILMADPNMGKIINSETDIYRAQVHKKSDPMATMVGDDTACCMPFGSGKGMVYFFTPNNAIFSIQKKINGEFRTIAQSVLTLDIDTGISGLRLPEDIAKIPNETFKKMFLTCDNVEVAPNFKDKKSIDVIEEMYKSFFGSYLVKYAESMGVDNQKIIIGTGYGDALTGLKKIANTFYTTSELSYSDNRGPYSYVLNTHEELHLNLHFIETRRVESEPHKSKKAGQFIIDDIRPSNILRISRIEDDIYGGMKQGIVEMQKMIEAYLIKEALAGRRECFMFKMMEKDEIASYLMATEDNYGDRKEIYIADFASKKPDSPYLNSLMMKTFFERYLLQYKDDEYLPPISAEFRENTSYRFIEDIDRLNRILKHKKLHAIYEEYGTEERGGEIFHKCSIFIIRTDEDSSKFDELKEVYKKANHYR